MKTISRRAFLAGGAGTALTLAAPRISLAFGQTSGVTSPYAKGVWLAGDHHIHTHFSINGQYTTEEQIEKASRFGLQWCVITDHGSPTHNKYVAKEAYAELQAARRKFPKMIVLQGLNWNMPAGEYTSVILPPTPDEATRIADFEKKYDSVVRQFAEQENTEAVAKEALKYLQELTPRPLVFVNHLSRRGYLSPTEIHGLRIAGPDVMRGFEGSPGHQAAGLNNRIRCGYNLAKRSDSWQTYPEDAYKTFGGYDWAVAKVGGLWDVFLAQGIPLYITANSNSHRHWQDRTTVDATSFETKGVVTSTPNKTSQAENEDFHPGEFSKTYVFAPSADPLELMESMRAGNMFTVQGGLIEGLEFYVVSGGKAVPMGGTLTLKGATEQVQFGIRIKLPQKKRGTPPPPALRRIDVIAGYIQPKSYRLRDMSDPSASVVARLQPRPQDIKSGYLNLGFAVNQLGGSIYVRLRGTNATALEPTVDKLGANPWEELWFYSNPILINVPVS